MIGSALHLCHNKAFNDYLPFLLWELECDKYANDLEKKSKAQFGGGGGMVQQISCIESSDHDVLISNLEPSWSSLRG